jgi:hypothetical protein
MPELSWDETEILNFLGVVPEVEEYGVSYHYTLLQSPHRLELTIWPMRSDIYVSLYSEGSEQPLVDLKLLACSGVRAVRDKRGSFAEFGAGNIFSGRYDRLSPMPYGFRLWVLPHFRIQPFAYEI